MTKPIAIEIESAITVAKPASLTLEEFLKLPETKPPSENIAGEIIQKPLPKTRHSRLQGKLIDAINEVTEAAVFRWQNIELDENEEALDTVLVAPDWTIEILSPDQSSNRVTGNILHCLKHGCQLGWLVDPDDRSIIVFQPQQQPELFHQEDKLVVLEGVELDLTAKQVFSWLKMKAN